MGFSRPYLQRCHERRAFWRGKETAPGDWYVDLNRKVMDVVSVDSLGQVRFDQSEIVFIPDADDLMELIDNQAAAWGCNPQNKKLEIQYAPGVGWSARVEYAERITEATRAESLHAALLSVFCQMILH